MTHDCCFCQGPCQWVTSNADIAANMRRYAKIDHKNAALLLRMADKLDARSNEEKTR